MAFSSRGEDADITDINVTPLVDITLVLLVVFMVTAKLVMSQAVPLDLPQAASAGELTTVLTVAIAPDGALHANGQALSDVSQLGALAKSARAGTPDLRAVIAASTRVPHGRVVEVLDTLRTSGLSKVAFAAEPKP